MSASSTYSNEYYARYQALKRNTGKTPKVSPDRLRQNALSASEGWLDQPKDFDWLEKNIPCQAACPAGTDIPGYLDAIAQGRYEEAYRINLRDNVFPAVLGRVCTRPCEPACRHGWEGLGEPVAICFSKRSAADFMQGDEPIVLDPVFPPSGKKVIVIGAGAAGLAAARELALLGHAVTVLEQHDEPGGMMIQGIPEFRLPRAWVRREIEQIRRVGVHIECGVVVGRDRTLSDVMTAADAVILAAGTMTPVRLDLPGADLPGIQAGLTFLQQANRGENVQVGKRVAVIGGGFTAVDCARMARRLGASEVTVYYRRTEKEMYITPGEVEEMRHEGIAFVPQSLPEAFIGDNTSGVSGLRLVRTEPGPVEAGGRRSFVVAPNRAFTVEADTVLLAIGQQRDEHWLGEFKHAVAACQNHAASTARLFVAGDYLNGAGSLIDAVASGKSCARIVDVFLTGEHRVRDLGWVEPAAATGRTRDMDDIPRQPMPALPVADRAMHAEVESGFSGETAQTETRRCYLCHYKYEIDNDLCIYCDRCLKVKPVEGCIVKVKNLLYDEAGRITGYEPSTSSKDYNMLYIDQSQCIRCGACRDVCPVECISLQKVSKRTVCVAT
ncbi:MAG TPA: FAD-dependent oxidoreductase [Kiritimatiellia bacterium]|nr:FAD-dependent oxidoreductase [Kiritimatiellia bacterium]HMO99403.1 FAD-dependent oxidoreductase [Kiritimatiellia bacterium]HMP97952.1 FAD-dependent oxidoreductase [Kiritimatiellia bacterium]